MKEKRWQDWVMLLFGVWLLFSPMLLIYNSIDGAAAWNSHFLGIAVVVFAVWALLIPEVWEEWVNLALAVWLIVAPLVLGYYQSEPAATWNHIVLGALIGADAIWVLMQTPTASHA